MTRDDYKSFLHTGILEVNLVGKVVHTNDTTLKIIDGNTGTEETLDHHHRGTPKHAWI